MPWRVPLLALTIVGALMAAAGAAEAATCQLNAGELRVTFDTTGDAVEIATDFNNRFYVSADSFQIQHCEGPISAVTSIRVVRTTGSGQALGIGEAPGHPWALSGGITVESGLDRVQILWGLTAPGAISIAAPVDACNSSAVLTSATSITIAGAIDKSPGFCTDVPADVSLTAPSVSVAGAIGAARPVDSLVIDSQSSPATIGGSVTTTGTQNYAGQGIEISGTRTLKGSQISAPGGISTTGTQSLTIENSATSEITGQITGALSVTKTGTGLLTLTGSNGYTGTTTVSAGTLEVSSNAGLGTAGSGTTVATGARLFASNGITTAEPVTLQDGSTLQGGTTVTLTGAIALAGTPTILVEASRQLTASGGLTGTGFTKSGAGVLALSAAASNTGTITVNAGTLRTSHVTALGTTAGGTTVASGGTLELQGTGSIAESLTLTGSGISSASALIASGGAKTLTGALALAGATTIATPTDLTVDGAITGASPLTKSGTGTLTLTNANSGYSGTTTVSGGTLEATTGNAVGVGGITLADGGRLLVSGTTTLPAGNTVLTQGSGTAEIAATGQAQLMGAITMNAPLRLAPGASATLRIDGLVEGVVEGGQPLTVLNGAGATTRLGGNVGASTALQSVTASGGTTRLDGNVRTTVAQTYDGALVLGDDLRLTATELLGGATVSGTGGTWTLTADVSAAFGTPFSGAIQSTVGLRKLGVGVLALSSPQSGSAAPMRVDNGTLRVFPGAVIPAVTLTGGDLDGAGTTGDVTGAGGGVIDVAEPARLTTGSVSGTGLMYDFGSLDSGTAGADYGQLDVVGTVALNDAVMYVNGGLNAPGDSFMILRNDGTDAVVGTFAGLPEGGRPMNWDGWTITYRGGTGNDVVITREGGAPPAPDPSNPGGTPPAGGAGTAAGGGGAATTATRIRSVAARKRVVTAIIDAAGAGTARLEIPGRKPTRCTRSRTVTAAGTITLTCKVKGKAKRATAKVTFTPKAGAVVASTTKLKLR